MTRLFTILALGLAPLSAAAEDYTRPVPQAQSATAEIWFLAASVAMLISLFAVNWLIRRR